MNGIYSEFYLPGDAIHGNKWLSWAHNLTDFLKIYDHTQVMFLEQFTNMIQMYLWLLKIGKTGQLSVSPFVRCGYGH